MRGSGATGDGVWVVTEMTCREAGRRGGEATRARIGSAGYRRLAAITNGRRGAAAQRASLGEEGMSAKARAGGEALSAQRGKAWYAAIGAKGAAQRKVNRAVAG